MKKIMTSFVVLSMALVGCSSSSSDSSSSKGATEIALITDSGGINDKSFNQSAWEAVEAYGKENNKGYKYYKPSSFDQSGYEAAIKQAVKNGAKVIALPGFKFATTVGKLQDDDSYKDVNFICVDFAPQNEKEENVEPASNVYSATYKEYQPGYLAGYAAVKDGYTKLGYMGGMALPAVINYGYGYVQGANDAAKELNTKVTINYTYTGTFNESPEIKTKAASWYKKGTEVIFVAGGQICNSVFSAAEAAKAKTIGVDSDQSSQSDTVITSAMKNVYKTVYDQVKATYDGDFKGGSYLLDASNGYVQLSEDFSRLNNFSEDDYKALFEKVKDGSIKILSNDDVAKDAKGDPNTAKLKAIYTNVSVKYSK